MNKKILSFILCFCLLLELMPTPVFAAEDDGCHEHLYTEAVVTADAGSVSGGDVSENKPDEDVSGNQPGQDVSGGDVSGNVPDETIYTVTFDSNGGSAVESQNVKKGEKATEPDKPEKENMNFKGWYLNGLPYDFDSAVEANITLVAEWTEYETLKKPVADVEDGMEVEAGTTVSLSAEPEDAAIYYTVDGTEPDTKSILYTEPIVISEELTIKAIAVKEGFKNSETAVFHYTVAEEDLGDVLPEDIPEGGIPDGMWVAGVEESVTYTGKAIKFVLHVYDRKTRLVEGKDYTVSYKNNVNAADADSSKAPTITVTGKGNYYGKSTVTFNILPIDIGEDNLNVIADDIVVPYTGRAQKPVPAVFLNGKKLVLKKDYTMTCKNSVKDAYTAAGTYEILLSGTGNYTGERTIAYTITETVPMSKVKISSIKTQDYTGEEIRPELTLKYGKETLIDGTDYEVTYLNNVNIGKATIIIKGLGKYTGTRRMEFQIKGTPISKAKVTGLQSCVYDGEWKTPVPVVTIKNGKEEVPLTEGTNYTVSYINNRNAGTATMVITGINGYSGTVKKTFRILPFAIDADTENEFVVQDGIVAAFAKGGAMPKPVVSYHGTVLTEGKDYTLKYSNNKKVADATADKAPTITVTGKGNFKGSKSVKFSITEQDIAYMTVTIPDKVYQNRTKIYKVNPVVTDLDGKKLTAGKDYVVLSYNYAGGREVDDTDVIPANTSIYVTIKAKENSGYTGTVVGSYRFVKADISKVKSKVKDQIYTGSPVTPDKSNIILTDRGAAVLNSNYEIVSYSNNIKKGTASITIKGVNNYGGTKKITFKIKNKKLELLWWLNEKDPTQPSEDPDFCFHEWDKGTVTKAATCTQEGVMTYTCTKCGKKQTDTIPMTEHQFKPENTGSYCKDPTCYYKGYYQNVCQVCGMHGQMVVMDELPHDKKTVVVWEEWDCGHDGLIYYWCSMCGEPNGEEVVPATGKHEWKIYTRIDSVDSNGEWNTRVRCIYCGGCGSYYNNQDNTWFEYKDSKGNITYKDAATGLPIPDNDIDAWMEEKGIKEMYDKLLANGDEIIEKNYK